MHIECFEANHTFIFFFFTESAPLGQFSHRVAMSVSGDVCVSAPLGAVFFRPLIGPEVT